MGHVHEHHHPDEMQNYLTQQIVTLVACGFMGAVAVSLYLQDGLKDLLARDFHLWVLGGGVVLLVMTLVRGIAIWHFAGELQKAREHHDHEHDHSHHHHHHHHEHVHAREPNQAITASGGTTVGLNVISTPPALPSHSHDHDCCDHDHGHDHNHGDNANTGHDHGWVMLRCILLVIPIALFFLNVPREGFTSDYQKTIDLNQFDLSVNLEGADEAPIDVRFVDLELAAMSAEQRGLYTGKTVRLSGKYSGVDDNRFTLVRFKINCCAADAYPLNAIILLNSKDQRLNPEQTRNKWVIVTGRVQFVQNKNKPNQWVTALVVTPTAEKPLNRLVEVVTSDPNPYAY